MGNLLSAQFLPPFIILLSKYRYKRKAIEEENIMLHEIFLLSTALMFLSFYITSKEVGSRRREEKEAHIYKSISHKYENA